MATMLASNKTGVELYGKRAERVSVRGYGCINYVKKKVTMRDQDLQIIRNIFRCGCFAHGHAARI